MINNLMLIDDDAIDQKLYRRIIQASGLVETLHQFEAADEALDFLQQPDQIKMDAILLDIRMPCMDGFEFLEAATEKLGDNFVQAAVIMLTTSVSEEDMKRARSFSVVRDYIDKPLTTEHIEMIDRMLV